MLEAPLFFLPAYQIKFHFHESLLSRNEASLIHSTYFPSMQATSAVAE